MKVKGGRQVLVPQVKPDKSFPDFTARLDPNTLHAAFGGGVGKFGANFAVFRYRYTTLWIDYGAGFPDPATPGMSRLLPDQNLTKGMLPDAIIFTHGHEDHIGGLQHILNLLPPKLPVYCSPYTEALLRHRLKDVRHDAESFDFRILDANTSFQFKDFEIHNFFMPHSIPQVFSVGLRTLDKKRSIYFTSDFKLQGNEPRFNQRQIQNFGPVDYLFIDSTGSLQPDMTASESEVIAGLTSLIREIPGRIFITTFASHVERLAAVYEIARKQSRSVGLQGFSLKTHLRAAFESAEFDTAPQKLSDPSPKSKNSIWIVAGCQCEPGSSFYRLAHNQLGRFQLNESDTVIYSGSMIPGNEWQIYSALNKIAERGTRVIGVSGPVFDSKKNQLRLHASGHGRKQDIQTLIQWIKPQRVVPVHGDPVHFYAFKEIIRSLSARPELHIVTNGPVYALKNTLEVALENPATAGLVEAGEVHFEDSLYQRRLELSSQGICTVILNQENWEVLKVDLQGVSSSEFVNEKFDAIHEEIARICQSLARTDSKQKEKKARERIKSVILQYLHKSPFISLQII